MTLFRDIFVKNNQKFISSFFLLFSLYYHFETRFSFQFPLNPMQSSSTNSSLRLSFETHISKTRILIKISSTAYTSPHKANKHYVNYGTHQIVCPSLKLNDLKKDMNMSNGLHLAFSARKMDPYDHVSYSFSFQHKFD